MHGMHGWGNLHGQQETESGVQRELEQIWPSLVGSELERQERARGAGS